MTCRRLRLTAAWAWWGPGVALLAALAGCGGGSAPVPQRCVTAAGDVERALGSAPGRVALADGTLLSACVGRATSDGDLQGVGVVFTMAAEDLARTARHDPAAALRLGFLIGACRRGGAHSQGVAAELVRHVEQSANFGPVDARIDAALHRGLIAGADHG
jgi:hypothetical protein